MGGLDLGKATLRVDYGLQRFEGKLNLVEPKTDKSRRVLPLPSLLVAALLLAQGVPPRTIMEILGHSQISITLKTSAHVLPEITRACCQYYGQRFRRNMMS